MDFFTNNFHNLMGILPILVTAMLVVLVVFFVWRTLAAKNAEKDRQYYSNLGLGKEDGTNKA